MPLSFHRTNKVQGWYCKRVILPYDADASERQTAAGAKHKGSHSAPPRLPRRQTPHATRHTPHTKRSAADDDYPRTSTRTCTRTCRRTCRRTHTPPHDLVEPPRRTTASNHRALPCTRVLTPRYHAPNGSTTQPSAPTHRTGRRHTCRCPCAAIRAVDTSAAVCAILHNGAHPTFNSQPSTAASGRTRPGTKVPTC